MKKMTALLFTTAIIAAHRLPATFEGEVFAFPDVVDSLDAVPERARGLYTADGDKFKYTDTGGLRNSLQSARNERDAARREAASAEAWKKLGKTPEEIEALLEKERTAEEEKARAEGNWDSLKTQMEDNHNTALAEKDKRINKLENTLKGTLIDSGLKSALADPEVEGNPLYLLPHLRGRVKFEETDEGFTTVVLREDGSPMLNGQNLPATLKDLALEFRSDEKWASAFKGLNQSGGGATGGNQGGGAGGGTKKRSEMSVHEKVAYIQANGQAKYEQLPE